VEKYYCTWFADIMWSSDGKTGFIRIDNDGKPFETTPHGFEKADIQIPPG
jgi:hypothetical protein